jgi:hypothetical protein
MWHNPGRSLGNHLRSGQRRLSDSSGSHFLSHHPKFCSLSGVQNICDLQIRMFM